MPWQLLAVLVVVVATFAGSYLLKPLLLGRLYRTTFLLGVAAFSAFGFLASFEFPGFTFWKLMYGMLVAAALAGATLPWLPRRSAAKA